MRVTRNVPKGNIPGGLESQTRNSAPAGEDSGEREKSLLSGRSAGIFGASLIVALCAAGLTYLPVVLTTSRVASAAASAAFVAAGAFAGSVRFLNSIVE